MIALLFGASAITTPPASQPSWHDTSAPSFASDTSA